jgi:hypothetical protein
MMRPKTLDYLGMAIISIPILWQTFDTDETIEWNLISAYDKSIRSHGNNNSSERFADAFAHVMQQLDLDQLTFRAFGILFAVAAMQPKLD